MRATYPLVLAFMTVVAQPAHSQRRGVDWPQIATASFSSAFDGHTLRAGLLGRGDQDHRYEGLYVGLGAGAAFTIWSAIQCSGRNDCLNPLPLGLLVTFLTSLTGALVGSALPK
jgi:hypothetical protein